MSDIKNINYEPLRQMGTARRRALKTSLHGWRLPVYVLTLIASLALSAKTANLWPTIIVVVFYCGHVSALVNKYKDSAWQEFAMANGWQVDSKTSIFTLLPPSINYGHSQRFGTVLLAQLGDVMCSLFTYSCKTGSGKNEATHNFTVARVALREQLPHIVLNSKSARADIEETIEHDEKLKLEGDFNKYFNLLIEKGQQINALEILTPDVMQILVSYNTNEDIEINGDSLYFISRNDKRDYKDMPSLINSIMHLTHEINENISLSKSVSAKAAVNSYT